MLLFGEILFIVIFFPFLNGGDAISDHQCVFPSLIFQWRLKRLWNYLFENYGMGEPEMDMIWSEAGLVRSLIKLTFRGS